MASGISVTIQSNRLPAIAAALPGATRRVVQKTVFDVQGQAQQNAPVYTGALRNSIKGEMTGDTSGEVSVGVDYGIYVHEGTHRMAGRPFVQTAAEQARPGFEAAVAALASKL